MCRRTHFDCETAEFSSGDILGDSGGPQIDNWQPAKVYISEVTERSHWLLVTVGPKDTPVIWRVVDDQWTVTFDEECNVTLMWKEDVDELPSKRTTHKLKFPTLKIFWAFLGQMTTSSIRVVYGEHWPKVDVEL